MKNKETIDLLKMNLLQKKEKTKIEYIALKILNSEFKVIESEKKEIEVKVKVKIKSLKENLTEEWWTSYFFELNKNTIKIYKLNKNGVLENI